MKKTLRLAIVGCGWIADSLAWLARITPGIKLVAACDISSERVESFARKHRIPQVFTDYDKMLAEIRMDAVYLAVPHNLHFEMIKTAVDADVHVFVEKPITRTLAEGREIVAYAQEKGIKVGVNYQYRYDKGCYKLARTVQAGELGRVYYARMNIPWHRERAYFENSSWHKTIAQAGGGTLITQASHLIDILLWAIGSPSVSVSGFTDRKVFTDVEVEDFAAGTVMLENGAILQITSSMVATPDQAVTVEVYGGRGTATYTDRPSPRLKLLKEKNRVFSENSVSDPNYRLPYWGLHALHRSIQGYRDWILKDQPFLIPGEAALPALAVVEAIYQSANNGGNVVNSQRIER